MPEYIDKEKLIRDLIDNRCFYPVIVKKAIENAPTEDVVPRSECEKWYAEYHNVKEDLKQEKMYHKSTEKLADRYLVELKQAKTEVAREIFEEIYKLLVQNVTSIIPPPRSEVTDWRNVFRLKLADDIADLKKKYIG